MRIIAGSAKGRKIEAPIGLDTRPTLDRVKESVFGAIQFDIYGKTVLDLFAGSGNLGIEALSRGAKYAVFCDVDRACAAIVSDNLKKLGFADAAVHNMSYDAFLKRASAADKKFDLVFLDPPYASGFAQDAVYKLCELNLLSDDALVIAEHSKDSEITPPDGLTLSWQREYRITAVTILRKKEMHK